MIRTPYGALLAAAAFTGLAAGALLRVLARPVEALAPVPSQAPAGRDCVGDAFDVEAWGTAWTEYCAARENMQVAALDYLYGPPLFPDTPDTLKALAAIS